MSNFSAFKVPERQFSDITQVQRPVEDTSGATAMSAIAQGISSTASSAAAIHQDAERIEKKQAKADAEAAELGFAQDFGETLNSVAGGLHTGELTDLQARSALTKKRRELVSQGADPRELDKQEASKMKTMAGKILSEGTLEQQAFKAQIKEYQSSNYYSIYASEEENLDNFQEWERSKADDVAYQAQQRIHTRKMNDLNLSKAEREDEAALAKEETKGFLEKKVISAPRLINNSIKDIVKSADSKFTSGEINSAEREAMIKSGLEMEQAKFLSDINITHVKSEGQFSELAGAATDQVNNLFNAALKNIGDAKIIEALERQIELETLKTAAIVQAGSPSTKLSAAIAYLTQGAVGLELNMNAKKEANTLIKNALERNPGGDGVNDFSVGAGDTQKAKSVNNYFKSILNNIKNLSEGTVDSAGNAMSNKEAVLTQVSDVLDYIYRADKKDELLGNMEFVVDKLANTDLGTFVRDNINNLDTTDQGRIKEAINSYASRVSDSVGKKLESVLSPEALEKELAGLEGPTFGSGMMTSVMKSLKSGQPTFDDIELTVVGDVVKFVGNTLSASTLANKANTAVSGHLTTAFKAATKVSGGNLSQLVEQHKAQIWPAKYSVVEDSSAATYVIDENGKAVRAPSSEEE